MAFTHSLHAMTLHAMHCACTCADEFFDFSQVPNAANQLCVRLRSKELAAACAAEAAKVRLCKDEDMHSRLA